MIRDLLDCILKFPIVKNNHENTTREKAAAD
jgi:hypothetical protein